MSKEEVGSMKGDELSRALPSASGRAGEEMQEPQRKEPTEEDFERYKGYIGQKWTGVGLKRIFQGNIFNLKVCKWFNVTKGFGFIVPDYEEAKEQNDDIFVHQSSLQMPGFRSLDEGEEVEFIVRLGKRGLEAENVTGLGGTPIRGHRIHPLGKRKEKEIRCYNCGQFGHHKAAKCKRVPQNVKACYICHGSDHLAADCPNRAQQQHSPQQPQQRGGRGGHGQQGGSGSSSSAKMK